jgi:AcrR family transcriptional regulator
MLLEETKTDPRVKRTRQLLQNALMDLVREKPVDSITVQDIAARAEVNRATFYAHFEDKYALLDYTAREIFQARLDKRLPRNPTLTKANLRLLILTVCEHMGEFIGHCKPVAQMNEHARMFLQVQPHLYELLLDWIDDAPAQHSTAAVEIIVLTTSWAIWGTVFQWARTGRKLTPEQLTDQILVLLQPGLQVYLRDEAAA